MSPKVMRMLWEGMGFGWAGDLLFRCYLSAGSSPACNMRQSSVYRRIVVFPYFLFTGVLVKRIYSYTDQVAAQYPDIEFVKAGYLNDHELVIDTFAERVEETRDGQALMNCQMCKYREQVLGFEGRSGPGPGKAITITSRDRQRS